MKTYAVVGGGMITLAVLTAVSLGSASLGLRALVTAPSQYAIEYYFPPETQDGITIKPNAHTYVLCATNGVPNILQSMMASDANRVYWVREEPPHFARSTVQVRGSAPEHIFEKTKDGLWRILAKKKSTEPLPLPTTANYFFSSGALAAQPDVASQQSLAEFKGGTLYYIRTQQDLPFKCGEAGLCGNGTCDADEHVLICPDGQPCRYVCEADCGAPPPVEQASSSSSASSEAPPVCGNAHVERGEECDDGDTTDAGWCKANCKHPPILTCEEDTLKIDFEKSVVNDSASDQVVAVDINGDGTFDLAKRIGGSVEILENSKGALRSVFAQSFHPTSNTNPADGGYIGAYDRSRFAKSDLLAVMTKKDERATSYNEIRYDNQKAAYETASFEWRLTKNISINPRFVATPQKRLVGILTDAKETTPAALLRTSSNISDRQAPVQTLTINLQNGPWPLSAIIGTSKQPDANGRLIVASGYIQSNHINNTYSVDRFSFILDDTGRTLLALPKNVAAYDIDSADMNGNGTSDIVAGIAVPKETAKIVWWENGQEANERLALRLEPGVEVASLIAQDMDRDRDTDLVLRLRKADGTYEVRWLEQQQGDTWVSHTVEPWSDIRDIEVADMTDDGYPDIMAATGFGTVLYIQKQSCTTPEPPPPPAPVGTITITTQNTVTFRERNSLLFYSLNVIPDSVANFQTHPFAVFQLEFSSDGGTTWRFLRYFNYAAVRRMPDQSLLHSYLWIPGDLGETPTDHAMLRISAVDISSLPTSGSFNDKVFHDTVRLTGVAGVTREFRIVDPAQSSSSASQVSSSSSSSAAASSTASSERPVARCGDCGRCGEGLFNACDMAECNGLGACVYTNGMVSGTCAPDPLFCSAVQSQCTDGTDNDRDGFTDRDPVTLSVRGGGGGDTYMPKVLSADGKYIYYGTAIFESAASPRGMQAIMGISKTDTATLRNAGSLTLPIDMAAIKTLSPQFMHFSGLALSRDGTTGYALFEFLSVNSGKIRAELHKIDLSTMKSLASTVLPTGYQDSTILLDEERDAIYSIGRTNDYSGTVSIASYAVFVTRASDLQPQTPIAIGTTTGEVAAGLMGLSPDSAYLYVFRAIKHGEGEFLRISLKNPAAIARLRVGSKTPVSPVLQSKDGTKLFVTVNDSINTGSAGKPAPYDTYVIDTSTFRLKETRKAISFATPTWNGVVSGVNGLPDPHNGLIYGIEKTSAQVDLRIVGSLTSELEPMAGTDINTHDFFVDPVARKAYVCINYCGTIRAFQLGDADCVTPESGEGDGTPPMQPRAPNPLHKSGGQCSDCARCGEGLLNSCDADECAGLGPCTYQSGFFAGTCSPSASVCGGSASSRASSSSQPPAASKNITVSKPVASEKLTPVLSQLEVQTTGIPMGQSRFKIDISVTGGPWKHIAYITPITEDATQSFPIAIVRTPEECAAFVAQHRTTTQCFPLRNQYPALWLENAPFNHYGQLFTLPEANVETPVRIRVQEWVSGYPPEQAQSAGHNWSGGVFSGAEGISDVFHFDTPKHPLASCASDTPQPLSSLHQPPLPGGNVAYVSFLAHDNTLFAAHGQTGAVEQYGPNGWQPIDPLPPGGSILLFESGRKQLQALVVSHMERWTDLPYSFTSFVYELDAGGTWKQIGTVDATKPDVFGHDEADRAPYILGKYNPIDGNKHAGSLSRLIPFGAAGTYVDSNVLYEINASYAVTCRRNSTSTSLEQTGLRGSLPPMYPTAPPPPPPPAAASSRSSASMSSSSVAQVSYCTFVTASYDYDHETVVENKTDCDAQATEWCATHTDGTVYYKGAGAGGAIPIMCEGPERTCNVINNRSGNSVTGSFQKATHPYACILKVASIPGGCITGKPIEFDGKVIGSCNANAMDCTDTDPNNDVTIAGTATATNYTKTTESYHGNLSATTPIRESASDGCFQKSVIQGQRGSGVSQCSGRYCYVKQIACMGQDIPRTTQFPSPWTLGKAYILQYEPSEFYYTACPQGCTDGVCKPASQASLINGSPVASLLGTEADSATGIFAAAIIAGFIGLFVLEVRRA